MLEAIKLMVDSEPGFTRKLYSQIPHSPWDNHFSGDQIMDYAGEHGFGLTMTCRGADFLKTSLVPTVTRNGLTQVKDVR